jgi:hypothetical protein
MRTGAKKGTKPFFVPTLRLSKQPIMEKVAVDFMTTVGAVANKPGVAAHFTLD